MNTLLRYMTFPLLIGALIFVGTCLIGPTDVPDMPAGIPWDKVAHFGLFFLLSLVSLYDYYRMHNGAPSAGRWIFWGFILPVVYGGIIELLQMFVFTGRSAEWGDWYADLGGSFVALMFAFLFLRKGKNQ